MFKKKYLGLAIAATLAAGAAQAALETSVVLKNETARFIKDGIRTGEATSTTDTSGEGKTTYKFENTAKIFLNDDLGNGTSWHGELNIVRDTKAAEGHKGHENYSQQDWLRELYADTTVGDWDVRLGKQQVVWGTADGIKLLDMINPTDWREFNQNTMADARIPVWMINAEKYLDNGANVQAILSQAERSKISGLDADGETRYVTYNNPMGASVPAGSTMAIPGTAAPTASDNSQLVTVDNGSPFLMKGVDTITGAVNGFLNIGAAMGQVTNTFWGGGFTNPMGGASTYTNEATYAANMDYYNDEADGGGQDGSFAAGGGAAVSLNFSTANGANSASDFIAPPELTVVGGFGDGFSAAAVTTLGLSASCGGAGTNGADCLKGFTEVTNANVTNLFDNTNSTYGQDDPNSTWEYMPIATFATFNTFVDMSTRYERKKPDSPVNFATRFRNTTANGLNYSVNYAYAYDANPVVNVHWENAAGERLVAREFTASATINGQPASGTVVQLQNQAGTVGYGAVADFNNDTGVTDAEGNADAYDWYAGDAPLDVTAAAPATLVFEETLERSHNIGASFDYAIDTESAPFVLRGEFLYQKDVHTPVIDRAALARGNLTEALKTEKADFFKYVIGLDTTVASDMMLSGQFIQFRNLDFIDEQNTCSYFTLDALGAPVQHDYNCSRYTGDQASMHLTNGLKQAEENKNFYSVFLSKPFGESGEGRWNNIFIYEEGGGKWNRFDVEYGINDQLIGTFEYNKYFGDENTMFGQFENASNVQIGLKYLLH